MAIIFQTGSNTSTTFSSAPPTRAQVDAQRASMALMLEPGKHDLPDLIFPLYCENGHNVGDELGIISNGFRDDARCPQCGAGKPWHYRWEL